jgi:glutamine synthetase
MALCLAAGLDGIKRGLVPKPAYDENVFVLSDEELAANGIDCLPGTLEEAIAEAEKDPFVRETLGDHVFDNYIAGKKAEWDDYRTKISQWEIDQYLINY